MTIFRRDPLLFIHLSKVMNEHTNNQRVYVFSLQNISISNVILTTFISTVQHLSTKDKDNYYQRVRYPK